MLLLLLTRSFNKELETSRKGGPATKITLGTTPNSLPNCEINSCSVGMITPGRMRTIIVARDAILGPIKNKPVQLPDGTILSPTSTEENKLFGLWKVHFELSKDLGKTWSKIEPAPVALEKTIQAIQPSILFHDNNKLQALGRSKGGKIFETWSEDLGKSWSALSYTNLPNPNSGTDAVTLKNGTHLLVYNHTEKGRSPLNLAISKDGKTWEAALVLEKDPGEYSYPAIIQTADGMVHITYTWKRLRVRHLMIDPAKLSGKAIVDGEWPK